MAYSEDNTSQGINSELLVFLTRKLTQHLAELSQIIMFYLCNSPDIHQTGLPGSTTVPAGRPAGLPQPPGAFSAPPAQQKPPPPVANNLPQPPSHG